MVKLSSLLTSRLKSKEKAKTSELAKATSEGNRGSFAGVFGFTAPTEQEQENLKNLLEKYAPDEGEALISQDTQKLATITCEVKAISNQAAILHGERIKQAQTILKNYKEGAFTAWLLTTYGNRQTPYNFLQYYEFYHTMPKSLHPQIESMPRQAVYTLASREGEATKKEEIVQKYKGESKEELVSIIRSLFPLKENDKRRENISARLLGGLKKLEALLYSREPSFTKAQKEEILEALKALEKGVTKCPTTKENHHATHRG